MEQTKSDRAMFSAERIQKSTPWFLAAVILMALFMWFGLSFSAEKRQRSHAFIDALRAERFDDAFEMCTPDLQEALVDAEGLQQEKNIEALPESFWWIEVDSLGNEATLKSRVRIWSNKTIVTMVSLVPSWAQFDPLPVLEQFEDENEEDPEDLLSLVNKSN